MRELAPAGDLTENKTYDFEFLNVEKQYESYNGINVRLRYVAVRNRVWRSGVAREVRMESRSYGRKVPNIISITTNRMGILGFGVVGSIGGVEWR